MRRFRARSARNRSSFATLPSSAHGGPHTSEELTRCSIQPLHPIRTLSQETAFRRTQCFRPTAVEANAQ
eukprot:3452433-Amphidinium_carterae.2